MNKRISAAIMTLFLIFSVASLIDVYSKPPMWSGNTSTIEGDNIIVRFIENRPWYMIWMPGKNNTAVYIVKFNRIVEFRDNNNNNNFDPQIDHILANAPLFMAQWSVVAETINTTGVVELRITFTAFVPVISTGVLGGWTTPRSVNVTFVNHIYSRDVEVEGIPIAGGREVKIDIIISNWPWADDGSMLALEIIFAGMFRGREGVPKCTCERYQAKNRHMSRVQLAGEDVEYRAEFRYQEEARVAGSVVGVNSTHAFGKDSAATWLVYPHFNGTLIHDPSIYVGSEGVLEMLLRTPLISIVVIAAILIIAAVLIKRRK